MKKVSKFSLLLAIVLAVWIIVIFNISPIFKTDARLYKDAGICYLQRGLACDYSREPFYPLFLSLLIKTGLNLDVLLPVVQNLIFLIAVFLFVREVLNKGVTNERALKIALLTAIFPTFLIPMNGSVFTESISASLILIEFALIAKVAREFSVGQSRPVWSYLGFYFVIAFINGALALLKGSFVYIQLLFTLGVVFAYSILFFSKHVRYFALPYFLAFVVAFAFSGVFAQKIWFSLNPQLNGSFYRGGVILYGRTEYAKQFDWKNDFVPYVVNGLSEQGCEILLRTQCKHYTWQAEAHLGDVLLETATDDQKFALGKENLISHPFVQLAFVPMEWTRFILHHGTTGFSRLELPLIENLIHSTAFNLLLKLFNLLLYVYLFWAFATKRISFTQNIGLLGIYIISYLTVYGFASTVIRMVYPIAPFIIILFFDSIIPKQQSGS